MLDACLKQSRDYTYDAKAFTDAAVLRGSLLPATSLPRLPAPTSRFYSTIVSTVCERIASCPHERVRLSPFGIPINNSKVYKSTPQRTILHGPAHAHSSPWKANYAKEFFPGTFCSAAARTRSAMNELTCSKYLGYPCRVLA